MIRRRSRYLTLGMLVAVLLLLMALTDRAIGQTTTVTELDGHLNYAYAVFVGTGWYKLEDRKVFVLRIPAAWQLREIKQDPIGIK